MYRKRVLPWLMLAGLMLGLHEGQVALYENGVLVETYPYPSRALPLYDQQALAAGIPVASREELAQLTEDLLS